MAVLNATKNTVLAEKVRLLLSLREQARGLMFRKRTSVQKCGFVFAFSKEKIVDLHMLFVSFPIDVLWLDKSKRVIAMKEHFRPFTFFGCGKRAAFVIELEDGTIKRTDTAIGDIITIRTI